MLARLVPWILAAAVIGATVSWIRRPGDLAGYVRVGQLALAGQHIYRDAPPGVNTWPPFFSLMCIPLAVLARPTPILARGVWLALNYVLLWLTVKQLAGLVYGREFSMRPGGPGLSLRSPEILLPLLLCCRFILGNFDHLQVNIVIFAAVIAGLSWHARGQDGRGGIAIGLAAALKVMPVVFVPYFAYRRRYGVALWAAAAATLAFSLSPALVYGWARFVDFARAWGRRCVSAGESAR